MERICDECQRPVEIWHADFFWEPDGTVTLSWTVPEPASPYQLMLPRDGLPRREHAYTWPGELAAEADLDRWGVDGVSRQTDYGDGRSHQLQQVTPDDAEATLCYWCGCEVTTTDIETAEEPDSPELAECKRRIAATLGGGE